MFNNNFNDKDDTMTTFTGDVIETGTSGTLKQLIHEGAKALKRALDDAEEKRPGTTRIITGTTIIGAGITFIVDAAILLTA